MEQKNLDNDTNIFKMIDIFETPITLSYNEKYSYETKFGGVLTIIVFLIIFGYSISNLTDLFKGNSYTLISNESEDFKYILNFSNVPFGFKLINSKGEDFPYDPTIYNFKIINTVYYFKQGSNDFNYFEEDIEFDYCQKYIGKFDFYNYLDISNLLCIKPGQNLTLYGKFGDEVGFKSFRVYVNRCNTKIENNTCLDIETINKKLANIKFIFFYLGYEINHYLNNKNIIQHKIYNRENSLSTNFMKKYYYTFQQAKYNLYNNLIFNHKTELNFYVTDDYKYDIELDSSNSLASSDNSLGYFSFSSNGKVIEYTKTLNSLWDGLSKIGGVFNIVVTVAKIVNVFIAKRLLLLDVNKNLINESSLANNNKIDINRDINIMFNNIENERIPRKENVRNESSSIEINNKSIKLPGSRARSGFISGISNQKSSQENVVISHYSRKYQSSFKIFKKVKNINKKSLFWFYICPFVFLKKIPKLKYFVQLEKNFSDCFSIENFLKILEINNTVNEKLLDIR